MAMSRYLTARSIRRKMTSLREWLLLMRDMLWSRKRIRVTHLVCRSRVGWKVEWP